MTILTERLGKDGIMPEACREYGSRHTELYRVILNDRSEEPVLFDQDDGIDRTMGYSVSYSFLLYIL
jgi:hypothetical protein